MVLQDTCIGLIDISDLVKKIDTPAQVMMKKVKTFVHVLCSKFKQSTLATSDSRIQQFMSHNIISKNWMKQLFRRIGLCLYDGSLHGNKLHKHLRKNHYKRVNKKTLKSHNGLKLAMTVVD